MLTIHRIDNNGIGGATVRAARTSSGLYQDQTCVGNLRGRYLAISDCGRSQEGRPTTAWWHLHINRAERMGVTGKFYLERKTYPYLF